MKQNILILSLLSISSFVFAESVTVLPMIIVKADSQETDVTGKLKTKATLNILGEKDVLDTPFTIRNYSDQAIQDSHAHSMMDVLKIDPSIRSNTSNGHLNENFNIRGFAVGWEDYNLNGAYGVAPTGRITTDILGSVTVLKGPNALVAGMAPSGGIGGVIIANTKRADKELTRVTANFEDEGFYKSGFDVARRFGGNEEFGARLSAHYGQGEHVVDGLEDESTSAVLALDWTTDKAKINLDAYSTKDKRDGGSPAMVSFATIKEIIDAPDGRTNLFPNLFGNQEAKYIGVSGEYKLLDNLKVIAGVGSAKQNYEGHLFGTRVVLANDKGDSTSQYYHVLQEQKSTTANLGFEGAFDTGSIRHIVGLRADYLKQDTDRQPNARVTIPAANYNINIYNAIASGGVMPPRPEMKAYSDNEFVSYSLTDQVSLLDDKLQLILGLRYQDMDLVSYTHAGGKTTETKYAEDKVSPSVGIVVKPFGDDISLYASYVEGLSKGSRVDNSTNNKVKDANEGHTFAPFETTQYEVGAKYQHGSWLHTIAAYQIEKPSTIVQTLVNDPKFTQITTDDGETTSKGIEYGFSGNVIEDLIIWGNLAYIKAEYTNIAGNTKGNKVQGQPEFTAGLGVEYKIPQAEGLSVNARGTYVDSQYINSANTLELPDYTLFDIGAKYNLNLGGVDTTFRANIDNVTNEKYWAGNFGDGFATLGTGRTYKLGLTFDF